MDHTLDTGHSAAQKDQRTRRICLLALLLAWLGYSGLLIFSYNAQSYGYEISTLAQLTDRNHLLSAAQATLLDTLLSDIDRNVPMEADADTAQNGFMMVSIAAFNRQLKVLHIGLWLAGSSLLAMICLLLIRHSRFNDRIRLDKYALNASYARNQAIINALPDLLVTLSTDGIILDYESGAHNPVLMTPEPFLGTHLAKALPGRLARKTLCTARKAIADRRVHTFEHSLTLRNQRYFFQARVSRLDDTSTLLVILDISQQKKAEHALQWQATHDSLTHLPNRVLFYDRLQQAVSEHQRSHATFALLYMDLDSFKAVNDTLGHQAGDALLQQVAKRLRTTVRASDTVARLAGDEFAFIVRHSSTDDARHLAAKIDALFCQEFNLGNHTIMLSASVGIAVYPDDGHTPDGLVSIADQAMYTIKRAPSDDALPDPA
ncbi:MAG: diguanylate cyclase [Natronospirillum sp.]